MKKESQETQELTTAPSSEENVEEMRESAAVSLAENAPENANATEVLPDSRAQKEALKGNRLNLRNLLGFSKNADGELVFTKKQKAFRTTVKMFLLVVGIAMMSVSVYFFQTPNHFTLGGVAGIAILLEQLIKIEWLTQSVIMAIINVLLIILGLIILGKQCTFLTIFCSLLYTGIIMLLEKFLPIAMITGGRQTLTDQPLLEMVYAILLFGVGGAIVFNCGASSGGTDIIALILKKFTKINVGMALMLIDFIVVCISIFAFESIEIALFSFMGLFAKSFLLDGVIESIGKTKYITIVTNKPEEIGYFILHVIDHTYTKYDAEGGYTGESKKVILTICKRSEALKLKTGVKKIDPAAFVIVTDANEILGKGFGGTI